MSAKMREQPLVSKMEKKRKGIMIPIIIFVGIIVIVGIVFNLIAGYRPPEHDKRAVRGEPSPEESFLFGTAQSQYDYEFMMASNLYQQENGEVYVYFTNPEDNDVNLRLELIQKDNKKVLYSTGYIKPGEYIERLEGSVPNVQYDIIAKIYAYTEDFTSAGTTEAELMLQPW